MPYRLPGPPGLKGERGMNGLHKYIEVYWQYIETFKCVKVCPVFQVLHLFASFFYFVTLKFPFRQGRGSRSARTLW